MGKASIRKDHYREKATSFSTGKKVESETRPFHTRSCGIQL
jgi:hypothetical protein